MIVLIAAAVVQVMIIRGQDGYTIFEGFAIIAIVVLAVAIPIIFLLFLIPFLKPSIGWARGNFSRCTMVAAIAITVLSVLLLLDIALITYGSFMDGYGILVVGGIIAICAIVHSAARNVLFIISLKGFRGKPKD